MKFKNAFFQNSKCKNSYLHRFEIVEEFDNGVLEICPICFKRKFFKLIENKVDNQFYMSYHIKSILPPQHPFYERQHALLTN
jgi:hypothetical protein